MSHLIRITDRLNHRLRRARPGSVLILVVALLVLMALLGTAYISTSRTDRYGAAQHAANTEIDLLIEGMINQAIATITGDLYGAGGIYRPPGTTAAGYEHYDSSIIDLWLADRIPVLDDPAAPISATNLARFRGVSYPFAFNDSTGTGYQFDRPDAGAPLPLPPNPTVGLSAKAGYEFEPRSGTFAGQSPFPFLNVTLNDAAVPGGVTSIPAADADGDGIADAGLWKIPVGTIDGVTYYAAFRIIDNNSAVNVNTAMSNNGDFNGATPPVRFAGAANENFGFFPSGVGLAEMLKTSVAAGTGPATMGPEFNQLHNYRFHTPHVTGAPVPPDGVAGGPGSPLNDAGTPRPDFSYRTLGDALYTQLSRRILNPGLSSATAGDRFHPFGLADEAALAYHGGLVNLDSSPSPLEQVLINAAGAAQDSVYKSAPNNQATKFRQYGADEYIAWFNASFAHDSETATDVTNPPTAASFKPRRTLLTTRNPVANQMPAFYIGAPPTYGIPAPAGEMSPYIRTTPPGLTPPDPIPPNPPRASVNTATFQELYRGYWNVMNGDTAGASPMADAIFLFDRNGDRTLVNPLAPRVNLRSNPYYGTGFAALAPYASDATEQHPARMFRSSIRDVRVGAGTFTPGSVVEFSDNQMMYLRAAIAAVNTIDLRDSDDDVTEAAVTLNVNFDDPSTTTATEVTVYGTERQPYITEVYVNNDTATAGPTGPNPKGYVAIELHNPHSVPITLAPAGSLPPSTDGWAVGLIDRRPTAPTAPELRIVELQDGAPPIWHIPANADGTARIIPPGGYLVLENYDPTGVGLDHATYRPLGAQAGGLLEQDAAPNIGVCYVPGLHKVFADPADTTVTGGEFVLLRTRAASAVATVAGTLDEGANLHDLIPVDSFDFTGMTLPLNPTAGPFLWAHYVRESLDPGMGWRFVYPGRYDAVVTVTPPAIPLLVNCRHQGVQQFLMLAPGAEPPIPEKLVTLSVGSLTTAGAFTNQFAIQLANTDFGGPNKGAPDEFPFGAFARNGDILQVPFIGAYKVEYPGGPSGPNGFLELNSVSMDSVFAEDTDTANDPVVGDTGVQDREQIGRFYPIARNTLAGTLETDDYFEGVATANVPADQNVPGEYWNNPNTGDDPATPTTYVPQWRYRWAMDLFDYLTVQSPNNDYFPNVPITTPAYAPTALPVANAGGTAADQTDGGAGSENNDRVEDTRSIEGLININTASWRVLATLPMVIDTTAGAEGTVDAAANAELAKAIVYWRDVDDDPAAGLTPHGPFKNIYELNEVVDLRPAGNPLRTFRDGGVRATANSVKLNFTAADDPGNAQGDITPFTAANDGVRNDFEERMLTMNRISNLITTRSDAFTCYLLVQGWRDAGTANPMLVVQRRVAFIVDRSETTPSANPPAKVSFVPNN